MDDIDYLALLDEKPTTTSPIEPVVMCDRISSSIGVDKPLLGKNNHLFIEMPYLPDRNKLCEVIFKDGSKGEGKLSIARGWFKDNGDAFTNKSPIHSWRYKHT